MTDPLWAIIFAVLALDLATFASVARRVWLRPPRRTSRTSERSQGRTRLLRPGSREIQR